MAMISTPMIALVLALATLPGSGRAADRDEACGWLLTEQECSSYLAQLAQARSEKERVDLKSAHASLLKERARLCPSHETPSAGVSNIDAPRRKPSGAPRIWM